MKSAVFFILLNIIVIPSTMADGLVIKDAWSRPTPPNATTGAIYLTIHNHSEVDERLIGASTTVATETEIHQTIIKDGIARMRHANAIRIPAGKTISLAPGNLHLMLKNLVGPLITGSQFLITLRFAHSSDIDVQVQIRHATF